MSDGTLSEQERVLLAANALSARRWVPASPSRARKWEESLTGVTSGEIALLTGLHVEVVEAAVQNIGEQVSA